MSNLIIIGAQWGDEGKGKLVDYLAQHADIICRFQGGHNAGHTLVINKQVFKLSLLPSGILRENKKAVIGNGVVLNPWVLCEEIEKIRLQGVLVSPENLLLSDSACLILPIHAQIDQAREILKGKNKIGTTGRGIGPAYEDKVARRAIRVCDLLEPDLLKNKVEKLLEHHNIYLRAQNILEINPKNLYLDLLEVAEKILPYVKSSWQFLDQARLENKKILFEGAQGVLLDIDHGTYPFVSSSNTVAANAFIGSGLGVDLSLKNTNILGVAKAYVTRVGAGPFPTKIKETNLAELIGKVGGEFGTVTGRKRDCGWLDIVLLRQAIKISGINTLALTKIDVLDSLEKIPVCVAYKLNGELINYLPASQNSQNLIEPVYEILPGWQSKTKNLRTWEDLPKNAKNYVKKLESLLEIKINIISTSPEREDVILRNNPLKDFINMREIKTGVEELSELAA